MISSAVLFKFILVKVRAKRRIIMNKKLLATIIGSATVIGLLPTTVMAANDLETNFTIKKIVEKDQNAMTPQAETFEFVLKDEGNMNKSPIDYGITILDNLTVASTGEGTYEKRINTKVDQTKINEANGWKPIVSAGTGQVTSINKSFLITEKNDEKDGWTYSNSEYGVTFKYFPDNGTLICEVNTPGTDAIHGSAEFTNKYLKQAPVIKTTEIPFTITVEQGGNVAPGNQEFELEIFDIGNSNTSEYKDVTYTSAVETNGKGDYTAKLMLTGPENQLEQFVSEGFYVREKDTKATNWTYSDAVWFVKPEVNKTNIYPTTLKNSANGNYYEVDYNAMADKMSFVNIYTENKVAKPTETNAPTKSEKYVSPKTGDNNMLGLWISLICISGGAVTGTIFYSRKKKGVK